MLLGFQKKAIFLLPFLHESKTSLSGVRAANPGEAGVAGADGGQERSTEVEPEALGGVLGRSGGEAIAVVGTKKGKNRRISTLVPVTFGKKRDTYTVWSALTEKVRSR